MDFVGNLGKKAKNSSKIMTLVLIFELFCRIFCPDFSQNHGIMGSGRVGAIGTLCRDTGDTQSCPSVVTAITKEKALQYAHEEYCFKNNETLTEPVFIYDGSIGRETWLVEVLKDKDVVRWIFITAGGVYERPAGKLLDDMFE